jgi:hypothetical protein
MKNELETVQKETLMGILYGMIPVFAQINLRE